MKPIRSARVGAGMVTAVLLASGCGTAPGKKVKGILLPQSGDTDVESNDGDANAPGAPYYGIHAPKGWYSVPIVLRFEDKVPEDIRTGMRHAARTWNDAVGFDLLTFDLEHEVATRDSDLYGRLKDNLSTIGVESKWACTGKPSLVIGTTIWDNAADNQDLIVTGDVVLNTEFYLISDAETAKADGDREVVDAESLALHELGHLIGLGHIWSTVDPESVMAHTVFIGEGITNRALSEGDIERVRRIYPRRAIPERSPDAAIPPRLHREAMDAWKSSPLRDCDGVSGE